MVALDKVYIYIYIDEILAQSNVMLFQLVWLHGLPVPATFAFSFTRSG
jgi:hypothetical protein